MNSAPPAGALAARTLPPCCSATWRTIARPEPGARPPARGRAAVEAVEQVREVLGRRRRCRGRGRARRPGPRVTSTTPPGGECLAALSSRLLTARASRSRVPSTTAGSSVGLELAPPARGGARARRPRGRVRRGARPRARAAARRRARARSGPRPASPARSSAPRRRPAAARARRAAAPRTRPAPRCSCAGDVIGVRSSCEASATSWRWAATERSSVSSIALKCCGELADLVVGLDLDPAPEVLGGGDVARGLGDVRRSARRRCARRAAPARPPARRRRGRRARASAAAAPARRRRAPASARAGPRARRRAGSGQHAHVRARHVGVGEERLGDDAGGDVARALLDRQLDLLGAEHARRRRRRR